MNELEQASVAPDKKRYGLVAFFLLSFAFTWANWLPRAASARGLMAIEPPGFVMLIAGYGPALAAILVSGLLEGRQGLRRLFASLARWRVGARWYLVALLLPPILQLSAVGLHPLWSGDALRWQMPQQLPFMDAGMPLWGQLLALFLIFVLGFDGLGEELGWRGFALPRLLERRGVLASSLILGLFWALWHLPYMFSEGSALAGRPLGWFLLNVLGQAMLYTWLYLNTRGSTLLAILFHAAMNTSANVIAATIAAAGDLNVYILGTALNWLVALVLLRRKPRMETVALAPR